MHKPDRVVVTGVGLRIPGANSWDELADLYRSARPATRSLAAPLSAWAGGMVAADDCVTGDAKYDKATWYALSAVADAVSAAGLPSDSPLMEECGVFVGCAAGGPESIESSVADLVKSDVSRSTTLIRTMTNAAAAEISIRHGCQGPNLTYAIACASSGYAIGEACNYITSGRGRLAIAGGAEAPMTYGLHRSWASMRLLAGGADGQCRPFSRERRGLLLGEGAVFFILESLASARARDADILAEISGYGAGADASHITAPNARGQAATIRRALADARLDATQIGHVSAHGTATYAGDISETEAIKQIAPVTHRELAVSATKSFHGHLLGAAGAVCALASLMAVRTGLVAPTVNFGTVDKGLDLDYVPNEARQSAIRHSLCNSFAFGGANSALIFSSI